MARKREQHSFNPGVFAGGLVPALVIDLAAHGGIIGALAGGTAAVILARHSDDAVNLARNAYDMLPLPAPRPRDPEQHAGNRSTWERMWNLPARDKGTERVLNEADTDSAEYEYPATTKVLEETEMLFRTPVADDTGGIRRLTLGEIVGHTTPNSFKIWVGRSLTAPGNPAVQMSIYKQHFRFMGASQRGKSSMVAAFLDIVTRTHDREHVLLALLDKEDQTSKLFAHLPHVMKVRVGSEQVKLHARNEEQVLEHLMVLVSVMQQRYQLTKAAIREQPIILVYLEEFLSLKNYFKMKMESAKGDDESSAISDYRTLVYCIEELAQRGLKARVQLLLCAQVEYADDDFKEALVNVQCGFAFCVKPTAAASAGFRNRALINRNAADNKVGQAVVETPDCNDLVLAPEYDLEQRLFEFEQAEAIAPELRPLRPPVEPAQTAFVARNTPREHLARTLIDTDPVATVARNASPLRPPVEPAQTAQNGAAQKYRLTDEQIAVFVSIYPGVIPNKDKALERAGANTAYRAHANEIIREYRLDK